MGIDCDQIYEEYRNADFTTRLNLYLTFPDFRNDFLCIEQKNPDSDFFKPSDRSHDAALSSSRDNLWNPLGFLKRLWKPGGHKK